MAHGRGISLLRVIRRNLRGRTDAFAKRPERSQETRAGWRVQNIRRSPGSSPPDRYHTGQAWRFGFQKRAIEKTRVPQTARKIVECLLHNVILRFRAFQIVGVGLKIIKDVPVGVWKRVDS